MKISQKRIRNIIREAVYDAQMGIGDSFTDVERQEIENIVQHILPDLQTLQNESFNKAYLLESVVGGDNFSKIVSLRVEGDICFDMDGVLVDFAGGVSNIAGSIENMQYLSRPTQQQVGDLTTLATPVATPTGAFGSIGSSVATFLVDIAGRVKHMLSRGKYKPAGFIASNVNEVYQMMQVLGQSPTFRQRFWQTLPLNIEGMQLFERCQNELPNKVGILTSPLLNSILDTVEGKKRWIGSNLVGSPPDFVVMDGNKQRYAVNDAGLPNLLIDDWDFNLTGFKAAGGLTALFRNGVLQIV